MLAVNGHAALVSLSYHSIKVIPFCFKNYFFLNKSVSIRERCLKNKENKIHVVSLIVILLNSNDLSSLHLHCTLFARKLWQLV